MSNWLGDLALMVWDLTWRGSIIVLVTFFLEAMLKKKVPASWRCGWWIIACLSFLIPFNLQIIPFPELPNSMEKPVTQFLFPSEDITQSKAPPIEAPSTATNNWWIPFGLVGLWFTIYAFCLIGLAWITNRTQMFWNRYRLSTDSRWLQLLEDAKETVGVTAPIGLIIHADVKAPSILGWIRPKILIPESLTRTMNSEQIKLIFLHELTHFKRNDIPLQWLMIFLIALHWFNPMAWLLLIRWRQAREDATDHQSLKLSEAEDGSEYAETLVQILKATSGYHHPVGALAITEHNSHFNQLKERIHMINQYHKNIHYSLQLPILASLCIGLSVIACTQLSFAELGNYSVPNSPLPNAAKLLLSIQPDDVDADQQAAVEAMEEWLDGIDQGKYGESWDQASTLFRKAVARETWESKLADIRKPLGKCKKRTLKSSTQQTEVPGGIKSLFVIAQFESSYKGLAYARETVTFEKEADGTWRASGYFIKPR